jgi:cytochrome oxidase assembly protein ShyY1
MAVCIPRPPVSVAGVYRFLLTPRWLAVHALAVLAVAACLLLGRWQLDSYQQGRAQPAATPGPPVELASVLAPGERLDADRTGLAVTVTGRYDGGEQLLVPDRELDGRTGYLVVTPLVRPDGAAVPVRRGWVAEPADPAAAAPTGTVTVTGVLQPSESDRGSGLRRGADLPPGQVARIANEELMVRLPYPPTRLYDGYVALTAQQPAQEGGPLPVPVETADAGGGRWQNLSYAGQWWLFAAAAVAFWGYFVRAAVADRRTPPSERTSATTARSATKDAKGTVPASSTSTERPSPQRR